MTKLHGKDYIYGFKDGLPIGLGYLSVSFSFGMMAVNMGIPWWIAVLISAATVTSAGQFAGIGLIAGGAPIIELVLSQIIINLRYSLMSASLSQKLDKSMTALRRLVVSFFVTDEVYGVASEKSGELGHIYLYGLGTAPLIGWTLGTLLGALAGGIMPEMLRSALSIALYAMFIAIILPPAKKHRPAFAVIAMSVGLSCIFRFTPYLSNLSSGFVIIVCAVAASVFGALCFPMKEGGGKQ